MPTFALPTDTPEAQERASLIHAYCVTVARDACIGSLGGTSFISDPENTVGCSKDEKLHACELDRLNEYAQSVQPVCDEAWRTAIACATNGTYPVGHCVWASLAGFIEGDPGPCHTEKKAFTDCIAQNPSASSVTGSRGTCDYAPGLASACRVGCNVGSNDFEMVCGGPAGVPLTCGCSVNGHNLGEWDFGLPERLYANGCSDAAERAANGQCTNQLDCCVQYTRDGQDACMCGSDPALLGESTCAGLASSLGGEVVPICPQYRPGAPPTCPIPPCDP